jgi:hypothetical protein
MGLRTTGQQPAQQNTPAPASAAGAQPVTPAASSEPTHGSVHPELSGDPGQADDTVVDPPADPPAPAPAQTQQQQPAQQPIIVDGRQFRDAQELATYTQALQQGFQMGHQKPTTPQPTLIDGQPIEQVMFNNPERYNAWVLEQAEERAFSRFQKVTADERNQNQYWNDFYAQNPDLKGFEFIVKSSFNQDFPSLGKMNVPDSMKHLAQAARTQVDNVKRAAGVVTRELPSGGATTLSASGTRVTLPPKPPEQPKTFVQQLRDKRPKRA